MLKTIAGAALFAALCLVGCGGAEPDATASAKPAASVPSNHVSTGVRCTNKDWRITFWDDATHSIPVGYMTCTCYQLEDLEGQESGYNTLDYEDTCDLR